MLAFHRMLRNQTPGRCVMQPFSRSSSSVSSCCSGLREYEPSEEEENDRVGEKSLTNRGYPRILPSTSLKHVFFALSRSWRALMRALQNRIQWFRVCGWMTVTAHPVLPAHQVKKKKRKKREKKNLLLTLLKAHERLSYIHLAKPFVCYT